MTIPARHVDFPYKDRENLLAADLEFDISELYRVHGQTGGPGGLYDNGNVSPNAALHGTKLLDTSIPSSVLRDQAFTGDRAVAASVTTAKIPNDSVRTQDLAPGSVLQAKAGTGPSIVLLTPTPVVLCSLVMMMGPASVPLIAITSLVFRNESLGSPTTDQTVFFDIDALNQFFWTFRRANLQLGGIATFQQSKLFFAGVGVEQEFRIRASAGSTNNIGILSSSLTIIELRR